ncbi:hypothetical protein HDU98_005683 [Podochytrium sp. JEL0797]|nr:hypothetical protein HDU98_005683 [Podochytrium sp. JEL0797]
MSKQPPPAKDVRARSNTTSPSHDLETGISTPVASRGNVAEDSESLLEQGEATKRSRMLRSNVYSSPWAQLKTRIQTTLRTPAALFSLLALALFAIVVMSLPRDAKELSESQQAEQMSLLPFDFTALHSGLFQPDLSSRDWVKGAKDGTYLVRDASSNLVLHHVDSKELTVLAAQSDLKIDVSIPISERIACLSLNSLLQHTPLQYSRYIVSPSLQHVLFESNVEKAWRHSFFATYHLFDVKTKTLKLLATKKPTAGDDVDEVGSAAKRNATTRRRSEGGAGDTGIAGDAGNNILGKGKVALTVWGPTGDSVAWVRDNNIFVTNVATETQVQITSDGSYDIMNGIADWVYEEEVLITNDAMWFSPDASHLAYLKFNDANVPTYKVQLFFHESGGPGQQYPEDLSIKYPKAGTNNPVATLHIATPAATSSLDRDITVSFSPAESVFPDDDRLIVEAKWFPGSTQLLVRMMNRVQDHQRVYLVKYVESMPRRDATNSTGPAWVGTLVRDEKSVDGAWLNGLQPAHILENPSSASATAKNADAGYLELAEDAAGFSHIAHYDRGEAKSPNKWLTTGEDFEVAKILHIDSDRGLVFYLASAKDGVERHVYSVKIGGGGAVKMTPPKEITWKSAVRTWSMEGPDGGSDEGMGESVGEVGWYEASFSTGGGYYLLTYYGPDVPFQKVVSLYDSTLNFPFKLNEKVSANLQNYAMPRELHTTIPLGPEHLDSKQQPITLNAKLVVPNSFNPMDKTAQYPVLISFYGGPNSQTINMRYGLSFESALAASGYIILFVDPRGTGFKGRAFRSVVSKQLGKVESEDVVAAASWLVGKGFVDPKRIAVWGWSYGGFLASKIIELDSGVISAGIAVAPVTDWKFYDSVYTERYMKTPLLNPKGYETSAVSNMTGFKNADFLLIHGTGDDNVHFQNTLALIYKLTTSRVHNYQVQFYPDSDHSMNVGNAFNELFDLLKRFLDSKFGKSGPLGRLAMDAGKQRRDSGVDVERHGVVSGMGFEWDVLSEQ